MTPAEWQAAAISALNGRVSDRCLAVIALTSWIREEFGIEMDAEAAVKGCASIPDLISLARDELTLIRQQKAAEMSPLESE